ncbi:unnamed protein product, partial [Adineta ricciae]
MTTSSPAYLLPGPSPTIDSKSPLIKQMIPTGAPAAMTVPATALHSLHNFAHHQIQFPLHRSSISSHSHQQLSRTTPTTDTFHSLTIPNPSNSNSLLTTVPTNNNNNNNNNITNNASSVFPTNNLEENGGGSGSSGHSLSQSMESINNIGFTDDE